MNYGGRVTYKVPKANPSVRERIMLTNCETALGERATYDCWWILSARS